jgi:hypothetical protein
MYRFAQAARRRTASPNNVTIPMQMTIRAGDRKLGVRTDSGIVPGRAESRWSRQERPGYDFFASSFAFRSAKGL